MAPVDFDPDAYLPPDAETDCPFERPQPIEPPEPPRSFFSLLGDAFAFPFVGKGTAMIVAGAVFFTLIDFIVLMSRFSIFRILGVLLAIGAAGYLVTFMFKVIASVAGGDSEPPDWPDFGNMYDDVFRPLFLVVGTCLLSLGPCIVYVVHIWNTKGLFSGHSFEADQSFWMLAAPGLLYLPMALLAVALFDSFVGLSPHIVIPAIIRVAPAYAVACGLLLVAVVARVYLGRLLGTILVLGMLIDNAVSLYFLMCEMYILGILYRAHEKKLGWFN